MSFFSVYKPGQGYWTRVMTAVGVGILVLTGAFWFTRELVEPMLNSNVVWAAAPFAQQLREWGKTNGNQDLARIASIKEIGIDNSGRVAIQYTGEDNQDHSCTLGPDELTKALNASIAGVNRGQRLPSSVATLSYNSKAGTVEITLKETSNSKRLYVDAAVAGAIIVGFAILMWWLLNKPRIVEFAIATEAEMRKVNWPSRREVTGSTWIVICGTVMMAFFLYACDWVFLLFFQTIGIISKAK